MVTEPICQPSEFPQNTQVVAKVRRHFPKVGIFQGVPPLPRSEIYVILFATDAEGERLPLKSVKSQMNRGRNPVEAGVGAPFYRNTSTFQDASGTWVNYALPQGVFCLVHLRLPVEGLL